MRVFRLSTSHVLEAFVVKIRSVLIGVLIASVALGTAGCNLIQPQATTHHYDASDGVGVNVGPVQVRNLILISDNGEAGQLMFDAVNTTGADIVLHISFTVDGVVTTQDVTIVSAEQPVGFGGPGEPQVQLYSFGVAPGGMLQLALQAADSETKSVFVPVLTTGQPEYNGLTPPPTPTPTPEPTIEPTGAPVNGNGTTDQTTNVEPAPVETPVG
jgi:hypothetical protein